MQACYLDGPGETTLDIAAGNAASVAANVSIRGVNIECDESDADDDEGHFFATHTFTLRVKVNGTSYSTIASELAALLREAADAID